MQVAAWPVSLWKLTVGVTLGTICGHSAMTALYVLGIKYGWAWWVLEWLK